MTTKPPSSAAPVPGSSPRGQAPDPVKAAKVDGFLSQARVERMRGRYKTAVEACEQALTVDPGIGEIYQVLGDLHAEQGRFRKAMEAYRQGLEVAPEMVTLEDGLARASLGQYRVDKTMARAEQPFTKTGARKAGSTACALSIVLPGLGQVKNEDFVKGLILVGCHLLIIALVFMIFASAIKHANLRAMAGTTTGIEQQEYSQSVRKRFRIHNMRRAWDALHGSGIHAAGFYILMLLDLGMWGYAIVDASLGATRREEEFA